MRVRIGGGWGERERNRGEGGTVRKEGGEAREMWIQ